MWQQMLARVCSLTRADLLALRLSDDATADKAPKDADAIRTAEGGKR